MVDVRRNDGAPGGDLRAYELRGDKIRDRRTEGIAVRRSGGARLASEVLANRNELHLGGNDAGARVSQLRHRLPRAGAQRRAALRKLWRPFGASGEPVVERLHAAPRI